MSLRREHGFTMVEVMIASALGLLVLTGVLGTLTVAYKTQVFAGRESQSLDDARTALHKFQRDAQGATGVATCATAGTCIQVQARTPLGNFENARYRIVGTDLVRDVFDAGTGTYTGERVMTGNLANLTVSPTVPVFTCTTGSGVLSVGINLVVKPSSLNSATFRVNSTIRPRNGGFGATC